MTALLWCDKMYKNISKKLLHLTIEFFPADIHYKSYDIAYYVGYDNPKNFSRAFKAYYGQSPSEYRKSRLDGAAL